MYHEQVLKHEEERRFERLGSKLKAQRMEAEERKKEREVKLTDRVPPSKRPRTGGCKSCPDKYYRCITDEISLFFTRGSTCATEDFDSKNSIRSLENPEGHVSLTDDPSNEQWQDLSSSSQALLYD
jgi:hypothetical protein